MFGRVSCDYVTRDFVRERQADEHWTVGTVCTCSLRSNNTLTLTTGKLYQFIFMSICSIYSDVRLKTRSFVTILDFINFTLSDLRLVAMVIYNGPCVLNSRFHGITPQRYNIVTGQYLTLVYTTL